MNSLRLTSAALGLIIAAIMLVLVRRDYMHTRYAIWWFIAAGAIVILGIFPNLVDSVGSLVGVSYPPTLLMVICMGLVIIKILTMDLDRSKQQIEVRRLTQRLAMLEEMRCSGKSSSIGEDTKPADGSPIAGRQK